MFKTLFSIVLFIVSMSASANTIDIQFLNSDLESSNSYKAYSSGEVYQFLSTEHLFFDIQIEDYSVVSISYAEPVISDELQAKKHSLNNFSKQLTATQRSQFTIAERLSFYNFHLRETLFPFHSFW